MKHLVLKSCHSITDELVHELCRWKASHLKLTFDKCEGITQKCKDAVEGRYEELYGSGGGVEIILAGYQWHNHDNRESGAAAPFGTSPPYDEVDNDEMEDIIIAEWGAETMNVKTESESIIRRKKESERKWREMKMEEERYLHVQRLGEQDELLAKAESEKKKLLLQAHLQQLDADRNRQKKALTDNYAERARLSEEEIGRDDFDSKPVSFHYVPKYGILHIFFTESQDGGTRAARKDVDRGYTEHHQTEKASGRRAAQSGYRDQGLRRRDGENEEAARSGITQVCRQVSDR